jgi:hypothetical protein
MMRHSAANGRGRGNSDSRISPPGRRINTLLISYNKNAIASYYQLLTESAQKCFWSLFFKLQEQASNCIK